MASNIEIYPNYDEKAFSNDVIAKWGSVNDCLKDDENLLHPQMGHLGRIVAESFKKEDGSLGKEILGFLDGVLSREDAISEIENAIAISFLEFGEFEELGILNDVPSSVLKIAIKQKERIDNVKQQGNPWGRVPFY